MEDYFPNICPRVLTAAIVCTAEIFTADATHVEDKGVNNISYKRERDAPGRLNDS